MKSIDKLNEEQAKEFLLKEDSYINFDLPHYFSFQTLISEIDKVLTGKSLTDFQASSKPRDFDDVNYSILSNKDGKYSWRPFQLINPALYVSLVHKITEKENWDIIQHRFKDFQENKKIECHSLPMISESEKTDKESQIFTWWQMIEQRSITLSLDYRYLLQTDITDCYGSIYTHSISWAIHTKSEAKKKGNRTKKSLIGVAIDNHLQDMSYGQTNGIPQGSVLMDFIAEMILGYVDEQLTEELNRLNIVDYRILRYRDDYRIFTNNPFEADQITKALSELLTEMGLKLNASKTDASENVIKNSIKPDKRYWIANKRITENKQKWLIQIFLLSGEFPNSGTVDTQLKEFLKVLKNSKKEDSNVESLISLVTEIAFRNPRVIPTAITTLSLLLKQIKSKTEKISILHRISLKFKQIPNSSLLKVWLQRLTLKVDNSIGYDELLCKKVLDDKVDVWNVDWLTKSLKEKINRTPIVVSSKVKTLKAVASKKEIKKLTSKRAYDYE